MAFSHHSQSAYNETTFPSPDDWFAMDHPRSASLNYTNPWPWTNLTYKEYRDVYDSCFSITDNMRLARFIVTHSFFALGIVGNFLILLTVAYIKRRNQSFNIFFAVIGAMGGSDFVFLLLTVARHSITKSDTTSFMIFYCIAEGLGATCSLISDMITLGLVADRFLALSYPTFYKKKMAKRWTWTCFIILSVPLASTRFHYSVENYYFEDRRLTETVWFYLLRCFSDIAVPIMIDVLLLAFTASICIDIVTWRSSRIRPVRCVDGPDECSKTRRHISLLVVMLASYLLNHIGYLSHGLSHIWLDEIPLSYFSSPHEIKHYVEVSTALNSLKLLGDILESIASSMTLFAYITVNGEFYTYFMQALSWSLEMLVFGCCKRSIVD